MSYLMTVGFEAANRPLRPLELFINTDMRAGSAADIAVSDAAIAISLALQHGCPARTLLEAMKRNPDGTPMGVIGHALTIMIEMENEDGTPRQTTPP